MLLQQKTSYAQILLIVTIAMQSFGNTTAFINNIANGGSLVYSNSDNNNNNRNNNNNNNNNKINNKRTKRKSVHVGNNLQNSTYEVVTDSNSNILDIDGEISESDVDIETETEYSDVDMEDSDVESTAAAVIGNHHNKRRLSQKYSQFSKDYYLTAAFIQSSFIAFLADLWTQKMATRVAATATAAFSYDYSHAFAIASVAATASGSINAYFLRKLEQAFPGKNVKNVSAKTLISTFLLGGAINAAYIIGVPLFSNTLFSSATSRKLAASSMPQTSVLRFIFQGWTNAKFITLTKVECLMFLPYHLLAFNLVPSQLRPLTQAGMAGIFNIIVSAVTLGYFTM